MANKEFIWDKDTDEKFFNLIFTLRSFFNDDDKVTQWMSTPNINLGGYIPFEMINEGRIDKLTVFVEQSIEENKRDE